MSFLRDPKRLLATILAGAIGLIVLIDFASAIPGVDQLARVAVDWAALLAGLALIVGLLSVAAGHFMRVLRRQPDWFYSLVLLVALVVVIVAGTLVPLRRPDGSFTLPTSLVEQPIRDVFRAIYEPLAASFLALLAFFSLSAALRALRRRTADAVVIVLVAAFMLALTALPQAQQVPMLGDAVGWIESYVVLAGARGLIIGASLGAVVAGVRVLLGFDQPYLDR